MKPLFVANWKMHMLRAEVDAFCSEFLPYVETLSEKAGIGIAPPFTGIETLKTCLGQEAKVLVGAQNVHWENTGAHTGEVSALMLKDVGAEFAIVGHSERRQFYGETDAAVSKRALAAMTHGLKAIVCIGESEQQYRDGKTESVVLEQLRGSLSGISQPDPAQLVIAYEPVWAIGTGLAATPEGAQAVHALIRNELSAIYSQHLAHQITILYGGSTKPENIQELVAKPDINGALVGGASLKASSFQALISNGSKG